MELVDVSFNKYVKDPLYRRLRGFSESALSRYEGIVSPKNSLGNFISYFDGRKNKLKVIQVVRDSRLAKKQVEGSSPEIAKKTMERIFLILRKQ